MHFYHPEMDSCKNTWATLVAHTVKNLPSMQETWVRSLGWEDPLEEGTATHSSIPSWRIPWTEEPTIHVAHGQWASVHGVAESDPTEHKEQHSTTKVFKLYKQLHLLVFKLGHFDIYKRMYKPCQFSSVTQSCPTLCNPMDCSTPVLPVHHQLPQLTQTHVHWVGDAIQPSHPLPSPSPTFNLSQQQGLFKWVSSSHQVARVLEFQLQHQSFQWIFQDWFPLGLTGSPCCPRDSQESSPTPQFKSINSSVLSFLYIPTLPSIYDYWKNHSFD